VARSSARAAKVGGDQDRDRHGDGGQRPEHRNQRRCGARLRQEPRGAEQQGEESSQHEVRLHARRVGVGRQAGGLEIGRHQGGKIEWHRPVPHHQRRQHTGDRNRGDRRVAAPGDRDGGGGQERKGDQRHGIMVRRENEERGGGQIDRKADRRDRLDAPRIGRRSIQEAGDDERGDQSEADRGMQGMRQQDVGGGAMDAGQDPERVQQDGGNREPAPQAQPRQGEGGGGDDRQVQIECPVIRLVGCDQQRRHIGTDQAEPGERRTMQQRRRKGRERDDAEQHEGRGGTDEFIQRIGRKNRGVGHGGAGRHQDAGNMRGRDARDAPARLLAPHPLTAADQSGGEKPAEEDAGPGAEQALLD
jgi:hypothetical protein